ncbi:hypothetical protein P7_187 [Pectobacterium phage vB_PcaM_P7_Pc]|nr:hypothetical protein P7_187 [Pectobacterium phage vB_PcaM_P7_Pc]
MSQKKDAERWRYLQQEGYFSTRGDGEVAVGVLKFDNGRQLPLTHCIEGRGSSLKCAVDKALRKRRVF